MSEQSNNNGVVINALRRVLAPVVRLMLAKGVTLPMAIELLKRVFVDVARTDFQLDGKAPTDSRISLLTGVHRKDVRRLRELPDIETNLPEKISLGAQVVGAWVTRTEWLDRKGRPKPLPRLASAGDAVSFERLVASISRDIRPRSVLDEWLRLGVVAVNEKDEVVLNASAFIPQAGEEEKLAYLGLNVGDHAAAAVDNVIGEKLPWFERSVHHTALTPAQVDALRARAAEMGMGLLQELHTIADREDDLQPLEPEAADGQRFTCGIYFYSAADEAGGKAP